METINWSQRGNVFNIQRFSLHDGKGMRTIVFFKGCGLRCKWCSNPESHTASPELLYKPIDCIHCGRCLMACPLGAIQLKADKLFIDPALCNHCGHCAEVCCTEALQLIGHSVTVKEIFDEVIRDSVFYKKSGGGLTLSGGEALLQPDFAKELLKASKQAGLSTAVETAGFIPLENLKKVLPYMDTFLYDVKIVEPNLHKTYTGQSNERILENLYNLANHKASVIVRIPVISGINTTTDNMERLVKLLDTLKTIKEVHLLPYHKHGVNKYSFLGRNYPLGEKENVTQEQLNFMKNKLTDNGYTCIIGG